jgi:hypothetical protein
MSSSDDGSGGGDLVDFVLYMFVIGPAVEWCLKSPKVNRSRPASPRGIALAVLLLAAIAGAKLSWELIGRDLNHFETLGVRVDSPSSEIKKAYKQISLKYHPDKNPDDKDAATKFIRYQSAYEVLKDASKRDIYNKFGQAGIDDKSMPGDTSTQLWSLSLFYIIWLVVGYLLTMGRASEDGRTWAFAGLLTLAVFEYQTKILSIDYLAPVFPVRRSRPALGPAPSAPPTSLVTLATLAPSAASCAAPSRAVRSFRGVRAQRHAPQPARFRDAARACVAARRSVRRCTKRWRSCTSSSRRFCTARA